MCGIVGYVGTRKTVPILIDGLKKLEYRGYDSAGVALVTKEKELIVKKSVGKIIELESVVQDIKEKEIAVGIAHTRWATHGKPNIENAHPHTDCENSLAIVHNGIIENYHSLKKYLENKGHKFRTETDTEVLAHLIEEYYKGDIVESVRVALKLVEGTYGIAVVHKDHPDKMVIARQGSPLIIGAGNGENFVASDVAAVISYTNRVMYLSDGDMAVVEKDKFEVMTIDKKAVKPELEEVEWTLAQIEKGGYDHFMLKEIFEQPSTLYDTFRGRIDTEKGISRLNGIRGYLGKLKKADRIVITACGTSWHAGLIGEYLIEQMAGIPVEVEYASEFRYRDPILDENTVVFAVSQSGETADTLAALREAKTRGAPVLGICNVVGSTIARESNAGIYTHAGPEIGVASTKAFTAQVLVFTLIALYLGRSKHFSITKGREFVSELEKIPEKINKILEKRDEIKNIAERFQFANNFLYLGRGINFPVALEGALKLKEISYIHAEGYPAAEMKHGPIALIDSNMPIVVIATKDSIYEKVISNIEEIKSRKGIVLAIVNEGDERVKELADYSIEIPETEELLQPLLTVIPLQLMAYEIAVLKGLDVDKPRNLAKSVTVE